MQKLNSFFLLFFLFAVLTSQALMEAGLALVIFNTLIMILRNPTDRAEFFKKNGMELAVGLWFLATAVSFAVNASPSAPWLSKLSEFRWFIFLYFVTFAVKKLVVTPTIKKWILFFLLLTLAYSYSTFVAHFDFVRQQPLDRIGGLLGNPMTYAHMYALLFCVLTGASYYFLAPRSPRSSLILNDSDSNEPIKILWLTTIGIGFSILLTYTRGVWISVFCALVFMAFTLKPKLGVKTLFALILCAALSYTLVPSIRDRVNFAFSEKSYDHERRTLWSTNFEIIKDYPFFGIGYGENARRLREYYDRLGVPQGYFESHAHNQFIHVAAGTGLVGLTFYLWMWLGVLLRALGTFKQSMRSSSESNSISSYLLLGCIGALVSFLIGGMTEANFEHTKMKYALMLLLALIFRVQTTLQKQNG